MDRLEEFIKNNREAFDDAKAPAFNWDQIQTPKKKEAKYRTLKFLALAASLALLISVFIKVNIKQEDQVAQTELGKELSELKVYYSSQVTNRFDQIKKYNSDPDIEKDIQQMDVFIAELEEELKDVPPSKREEIIEAMIKNYHYKLMMLDRVLNQIKKSEKENKDDSIDI